MDNKELTKCRVCGWDFFPDYPWGVDGSHPEYIICSCCGSESGYDDATLESVFRSRKEWIKSGYKWFQPKEKPENWSPEIQMKNIPKKYMS